MQCGEMAEEAAALRRVEKVRGHLDGQQRGGAADKAALPPGGALSAAEASAVRQGDCEAAYDYIVVGAGSAGCALAARLSEDPKVSVLLLEAGGDNQDMHVRGPLLPCPRLQNTARDWALRSTPQAGTAGRVSHQPRGKMLGGSSSINYMIYCRGDPRNYDQWAREEGCGEQWSYAQVLPLFIKSERLVTSGAAVDAALDVAAHGRSGPLAVTAVADPRVEFVSRDLCERFVRGCAEQGIPGGDYNGRKQEGASMSQVTVENGVRQDTFTSFLARPGALERANLTVLCYAHVQQVALQGARAVGVVFKSGNLPTTTLGTRAVPSRFVAARKEVVLCAGAFHTPQLLMLSGLGPREHLEEMGIPVVRDLPGVGSNLQDHLMVPLTYAVKDEAEAFSASVVSLLREVFNYVVRSAGSLMLPFVLGVAFFRSGLRREEDGNDLQIHYVPYTGNGDQRTATNNLGFDPKLNPRYDVALNPSKHLTFLPSLVRPKSTGTVRLRSNSAFDPPLVDPRFLSDPSDVEALLICMKKTRQIARSAAFAPVLGPEKVNPFSKFAPETDEYLRECIEDEVVTIYHASGTCKMGRQERSDVVVDASSLKVKGFENLRIADCSIMPQIVSGNTNAPAIMIAEKCAEIVLKDLAAERQRNQPPRGGSKYA